MNDEVLLNTSTKKKYLANILIHTHHDDEIEQHVEMFQQRRTLQKIHYLVAVAMIPIGPSKIEPRSLLRSSTEGSNISSEMKLLQINHCYEYPISSSLIIVNIGAYLL